MPPDTEVIVVGGGPAGSVTAWLLAAAGHQVTLLDKARFPRAKACSEYVNAGGVAVLDELGVLPDLFDLGAHRMEAMHLHAPGGATFLVDFNAAGRFAIGLSRSQFDAYLLERARWAGADVIERAHVRSVAPYDGTVSSVEATIGGRRQTFSARLVIGADGLHSVVARSRGLEKKPRWPHRTGLSAHFTGIEGLDRWGEMHATTWGYIGLAPLEDGITNVALVADSQAIAQRGTPLDAYFETALASTPAVWAKVRAAERVSPIRGVGPMARGVRSVVDDGLLLVGDAAGFLDPFTGDGIYEALRAAQLAARTASSALDTGDCSVRALASYPAERRRVFRRKQQVCWIVQGFLHLPPLMDYVTPRLAGRATVGATLTGVLGNYRPAGEALSPSYLARLLRP